MSPFNQKSELKIIGLMSGTSLDGLDIAACIFNEENANWNYEIKHCKTVPYSKELKEKLRSIESSSAEVYAKFDQELGKYFGEQVKTFCSETNFNPDYISSHGHTIFHQPDKQFTAQIGHPAAIKAHSGIPVIADFRTLDVHLKGQGAPLVPIGDLLLFKNYTHCINLGGIANISIKQNDGIIAFDISICNIAFNFLAKKLGSEYDQNGDIAAKGKIIQSLKDEILNLEFHQQNAPKSLGREWFESSFKPILEKHLSQENLESLMSTVNFALAELIAQHLNTGDNVLITGGGAYNNTLISNIRQLTNAKISIPNDNLIEHKESLIFAFLGALRVSGEQNILNSVTGAEANSISGCVYA